MNHHSVHGKKGRMQKLDTKRLFFDYLRCHFGERALTDVFITSSHKEIPRKPVLKAAGGEGLLWNNVDDNYMK